MRILFCRVGWMKNYQGQYDDDKLTGGGSFVEKHGTGSEIHNFTVERISSELFDLDYTSEEYVDVCLGYVHYRGQIMLERLGAKQNDKYVDGVLVIWVAPYYGYKDDKLIGWYYNSRVYRHYIDPEDESYGASHYNDECIFNIIANAKNCVLLPESKRTYPIPRAKGYCSGIGQANVWYADGLNDGYITKGALKTIHDYYNTR